jgi:hypothetical protein
MLTSSLNSLSFVSWRKGEGSVRGEEGKGKGGIRDGLDYCFVVFDHFCGFIDLYLTRLWNLKYLEIPIYVQ